MKRRASASARFSRGCRRAAFPLLVGTLLSLPGIASGQSLRYEPDRGESFRYRTENTLTVTQRVLEQENHYTLASEGVVRLTLLDPGSRLLWRLGFERLRFRVEGAFPTPRTEGLQGAVVTFTTTPRGVVLDARAAGIVSPGLGAQYLERSAAAFFPHLPEGEIGPRGAWTDTVMVTEVLQGISAEVRTVVSYTVSDTSTTAGRRVVPIEYTGEITVTGTGTIEGGRVALEGSGEVEGHYLFDPAEGLFALHVQEQELDSTLTLTGPEGEPVAIPSRQVLRARAERLY